MKRLGQILEWRLFWE